MITTGFIVNTITRSDHELSTQKLQRQNSFTSLDLTMNNLSDIQIFAAADLEQASDINLTKAQVMKRKMKGTNRLTRSLQNQVMQACV